METLRAPKLIFDPRDPSEETVILVPEEDLLDNDPDETVFFSSQKVVVQFPAQDGHLWEVMGTVVDLDFGEDNETLLVFVKIPWEQSVPLANATSQ